ncbi:hypothetical protein FBEOM_1674 [Fusarium beomiforme]|uniref:Uncharacterized protein n=1 Tax=Fusarium beomiforme TaxID=44412 RepID=A0A9P5ASP7_9HYPO|nr:hypothetical protein FBEOM_1674 [Fusarium beomiforme]
MPSPTLTKVISFSIGVAKRILVYLSGICGGPLFASHDGSLLLKNNQFQRSGNLTFTLRPGAKTASKTIAEYDGCAIGSTAVKVERNHTVGCPILAENASPKPKPCDLDVKKARSSLAEAVAKPTTSLTVIRSKTTDLGVTGTGTATGSASEPTNTRKASGKGSSGEGYYNGAHRMSIGSSGIITLLTTLAAGLLLGLVV